ncbi:MAG TPA: hypothetical protein PKA50_10740 [Gemmatimonadales bacterium]|nr:hypothetical protein [Gemmatimonadales bacterium]
MPFPTRFVAPLLTLALACSRAPAAADPPAAVAPEIGRILGAEALFPLEIAGVTPGDTTVTFARGRPRTIILRHGPPDNTVFVEVTFPAEAFAGAGAPESITVTVAPAPGVYGLTVTSTLPPAAGARLRFKYPVHFAAPTAGLARYGSVARFERALVVLVRLEDGTWGVLPSSRPASDNLEAPLRGPGTYLVAAPR